MAAPYFGSGYWGGLGGGGFLSPTSGPPPGGTVTATWTPPADVVTEGYRYLRLRCRAAVAGNITVQLVHSEGEDKTYTLAVGTTYADREIDLCFPDTRPDDIDPQQSRWPLKGFGLPPEFSRQHWGFNQFEQMVITVDASMAPLEIDEIALVRRDHGRGSILPAFSPWQTAWVATGVDTTTQKAFWWSDADGRHSDRAAVFKIQPVSGPVTYNFYSITDTFGQMTTPRGWVLTVGGPFPTDGYHTNSLPGLLLGGGGVRYDWGPPGGWVHEVDRDYDAPRAVFAQALWHEVQVYPQAGDVWRGAAGDYGVATPLRTAKVMRALAWGLLFTGSGPKAGGTATLLAHPSDAVLGSDVSDAKGHFQTGAPFAAPQNVKLRAGATVTPNRAVYARGRTRWALLWEGLAGALWNAHAPGLGNYHEAISGAGNVVHRSTRHTEPPMDLVTELMESAEARFALRHDGAVIYVAVVGSDIRRFISYDQGATVENMAIEITNAIHPMISLNPLTGAEISAGFRYDSGTSGPGKIVLRRRAPGETSLSAEYFLGNGSTPFGFEDDTFGMSWSSSAQNAIVLLARTSGSDDATRFISYDQGLTWAEV